MHERFFVRGSHGPLSIASPVDEDNHGGEEEWLDLAGLLYAIVSNKSCKVYAVL